MVRFGTIVLAMVLVCFAGLAAADVFNMGSNLASLDMVTVGDAGNLADTRVMNDRTTGYGSVAYIYRIGEYEVTASQYCDFLNEKANADPYGLWNTNMANASIYGCNIQRHGTYGDFTYTVGNGGETDLMNWGNKPVSCVSYWNACRFTNWLANGQGCGDTEDGGYTLNGYNGNDGRTIQRNEHWTWALPSEDEWYKAAYYRGGGTHASYWFNPTGSLFMCNTDMSVGRTTDVANYPYPSAYGTYDQGGNVWEWNEAIVAQNSTYALRGIRGGSFMTSGSTAQSLVRYDNYSTATSFSIGFRVVQAVPEATSATILLAGLSGIVSRLARRRRN